MKILILLLINGLIACSAQADSLYSDGDLGGIDRNLNDVLINLKESQPIDDSKTGVKYRADQIRQQIQIAKTKLKEVDTRIKVLNELNIKIKNEKEALKEDKDKISKEKSDIESREKLFSMGFYTSLATAFIALFSLFVRLPNSRLERELILLEIEQKKVEIQKFKATT